MIMFLQNYDVALRRPGTPSIETSTERVTVYMGIHDLTSTVRHRSFTSHSLVLLKGGRSRHVVLGSRNTYLRAGRTESKLSIRTSHERLPCEEYRGSWWENDAQIRSYIGQAFFAHLTSFWDGMLLERLTLHRHRPSHAIGRTESWPSSIKGYDLAHVMQSVARQETERQRRENDVPCCIT